MTRRTNARWSRRRMITAAGGFGVAMGSGGCISGPPDARVDAERDPSSTDQSARGEGTGDAVGWPQFGSDVRNTGHAPTVDGPSADAAVRWRFDAGTPTMNTSPVVVDGTVYVAGSGDPGYVYAVDAVSGEAEWQFEPAGYATSAPAVVDDVLYVGTWGRRFYAIDATTGAERWSTDVGHRIGPSSPAVAEGTVYVGTVGDGPLVVGGPEDEEAFEPCAFLALDATSGEERWRYDAFGEKDRISSSPALADGRVYFGAEDAVYALRADTGEVVWAREIPTHPESSPTVVDGVLYYGATLGSADEVPARVWALDAASGETIWSAGIDDAGLRSSPAVANGTVYVPASSNRVCFGGGETSGSGGAGDGGSGGGGSGDGGDGDGRGDGDRPAGESECSGVTRGRLYAINAATGERRWRAPIETDTRSSPAVAGDAIYVGCRNGISAVTAAGEPAWRIDFESDRDAPPYVKSSPAVAGGLVFVGASDGRLRAIGE